MTQQNENKKIHWLDWIAQQCGCPPGKTAGENLFCPNCGERSLNLQSGYFACGHCAAKGRGFWEFCRETQHCNMTSHAQSMVDYHNIDVNDAGSPAGVFPLGADSQSAVEAQRQREASEAINAERQRKREEAENEEARAQFKRFKPLVLELIEEALKARKVKA